MGYLATEIIVLLGGAAVLGLIIGWALFGLGNKAASTGAPNPKVDAELKAERDARKKAEGRIFELESKETNFNDRLQERDVKVAELSHQLDDLSKYRVQSAAELDARDQRITGLEGQLRQRDADLQRAAGGLAPTSAAWDGEEKLVERDRLIARLKGDLETAQAAASPDGGRLRDLERENAELRQTLIATDGAAPTTTGEKDAIIARLNEEVTGLRAAYESAEQALEEQDAAIDKLTRDLQATQHKLTQATGDARPQSGLTPVSGVRPRPDVSKPVEAARVQTAPPAKVEPAKALVQTASPAKAAEAPKVAAPVKAAEPARAPENESTMAISLADLVGQIDQKADQKAAAAPALVTPVAAKPAAAPAPAPVAAAPVAAAPAAKAPVATVASANESTVAISLADLVGQIDEKEKASPAATKAPPAPAPVDNSESTMALSLDALVAQIDQKAEAKAAPNLTFAPAPAPAPAQAPAAVDANESTVAISLADLVGQIDSANEVKLKIKAAPAGALDDLKEIRGIGPATEKRLNSAGIMTWIQMAELSENELTMVADLLKISVDKIKREQWVEQARALGPKT